MSFLAKFPPRLNAIKINLLSRDPRMQINAVNILINELEKNDETTSERVADYLIGSDIVEILCEALSTLDVELLQKIFKAMGLLSVSGKFFENCHTLYVISSVLRTLHTLLLNHKEEISLCTGIELLAVIISRMNHNDIELNSVCDLDQLLQIMRKLINNPADEKTVLHSSELFNNILLNLETPEPTELLKKTISEYLSALCFMAEFSESITLIAEIVKETIRLFVTEDVNKNLVEGDEIYNQLQEILYNVLIPTITSVNINETNPNILAALLSSILSFYYGSDVQTIVAVSYELARLDFITLLTTLENISEDVEFSVVIRALLCEILVCLSQHNLGDYDWRATLVSGFSGLTERISFWSYGLQKVSVDGQSSIIIYYYFNFLTCNKPNLDDNLLHNLASYIRSKIDEPPGPILKAFWLVFSITYLSSQNNDAGLNSSVKRLVSWLSRKKIESVYTHHPAILYWTFSYPRIQKELQKNVMSEWLSHDDEISLTEVKMLALLKEKACSTLIDILSSCEGNVVNIVLELMVSVLTNKECHFVSQISEEAWALLPHIITSYSDRNQMKNITAFWKICSRAVPNRIELTILSKLLCSVPGLLIKYYNVVNDGFEKPGGYHETFADALQFLSVLLVLSSSYNHKSGITAILNNEPFLNLVEARLCDQNVCTNPSTIQFITHLLKFQAQHEIKSSTAVELSLETLMSLLYSDERQVEYSLQMLSSILEVGNWKNFTPIVKMTIKSAAELRALYTQLHMLCFKFSDEMAACCWKCLRQLLKFSYRMKEEDRLAMNPFTPRLLMASRESGGGSAWTELLSFLCVWLPALEPLSRRRLATPAAQAAVADIVELLDQRGAQRSDPTVVFILKQAERIGVLPAYMKSILRPNITVK